MDQKTSNTLQTIASGALAIGGLLLLLILIFDETKDYRALKPALAAVVLSNLLNLIRLQMQRKSGRKSNGEKELEEEHHE